MLNWFARRMKEAREHDKTGEGGFTLIELLVVVIIIGILAAIAIPTFLNQREKAQDADAVSGARNAATALKSQAVACGGLYRKGATCGDNLTFDDAKAADGALNKYTGTVTAVGTDGKNIKIEVNSASTKKAIFTTADSKVTVS